METVVLKKIASSSWSGGGDEVLEISDEGLLYTVLSRGVAVAPDMIDTSMSANTYYKMPYEDIEHIEVVENEAGRVEVVVVKKFPTDSRSKFYGTDSFLLRGFDDMEFLRKVITENIDSRKITLVGYTEWKRGENRRLAVMLCRSFVYAVLCLGVLGLCWLGLTWLSSVV